MIDYQQLAMRFFTLPMPFLHFWTSAPIVYYALGHVCAQAACTLAVAFWQRIIFLTLTIVKEASRRGLGRAWLLAITMRRTGSIQLATPHVLLIMHSSSRQSPDRMQILVRLALSLHKRAMAHLSNVGVLRHNYLQGLRPTNAFMVRPTNALMVCRHCRGMCCRSICDQISSGLPGGGCC